MMRVKIRSYQVIKHSKLGLYIKDLGHYIFLYNTKPVSMRIWRNMTKHYLLNMTKNILYSLHLQDSSINGKNRLRFVYTHFKSCDQSLDKQSCHAKLCHEYAKSSIILRLLKSMVTWLDMGTINLSGLGLFPKVFSSCISQDYRSSSQLIIQMVISIINTSCSASSFIIVPVSSCRINSSRSWKQ